MTCDLVKTVSYNGIFAFMYSPRQGTPAATMDGQVSQEEKNKRVNALLKLEKEISLQKNNEMIGKVENCIVERKLDTKDLDCYIVKTDSGKTIIVQCNDLQELSFVDVKITKIENNQLYGEVLN